MNLGDELTRESVPVVHGRKVYFLSDPPKPKKISARRHSPETTAKAKALMQCLGLTAKQVQALLGVPWQTAEKWRRQERGVGIEPDKAMAEEVLRLIRADLLP